MFERSSEKQSLFRMVAPHRVEAVVDVLVLTSNSSVALVNTLLWTHETVRACFTGLSRRVAAAMTLNGLCLASLHYDGKGEWLLWERDTAVARALKSRLKTGKVRVGVSSSVHAPHTVQLLSDNCFELRPLLRIKHGPIMCFMTAIHFYGKGEWGMSIAMHVIYPHTICHISKRLRTTTHSAVPAVLGCDLSFGRMYRWFNSFIFTVPVPRRQHSDIPGTHIYISTFHETAKKCVDCPCFKINQWRITTTFLCTKSRVIRHAPATTVIAVKMYTACIQPPAVMSGLYCPAALLIDQWDHY